VTDLDIAKHAPVADDRADTTDVADSTLGTSSAHADRADTADTDDAPLGGEDDSTQTVETSNKTTMSPARLGTLIGLITVVALAGLVGWLGCRAYASRQAQDQRNLFLQVGRQGAVNLTTIDWQHADTDIRRILDGATGAFYDDFAKRSQPFIDVVKQTKSTTVGTITAAGLESEGPREAQVLVTVSVKTSNAVAPEQDPRYWRMRISVQEVGDQAKVSNVEFVP
jgi:Mce-associated membrane protein